MFKATQKKIQQLIKTFETVIETYNGHTVLKLKIRLFDEVVFFHKQSPTPESTKLIKLIMDFAAMTKLNQLFWDLAKLHAPDETTLIRAILCGNEKVVFKLLQKKITTTKSLLPFAFYSSLSPDCILEISKQTPDDQPPFEMIMYSSQPLELCDQFYPDAVKVVVDPATALVYFVENLADHQFCPPASLILKSKSHPKSALTPQENQFVREISDALTQLVKNPTNPMHALELQHIYNRYQGITINKLFLFDENFTRNFLHYVMIQDDFSGVEGISTLCKPNSRCLNMALLNNLSEKLILKLLTYPEVQPDTQTLNCLLFSKASKKVIDALLELNIQSTIDTKQIIAYSHLPPESIIKIAKICGLQLPTLGKSAEESLQFYKDHCPEYVTIVKEPAAFSSKKISYEGIDPNNLKEILAENKIDEAIKQLNHFIAHYSGDDCSEVKNQIPFILEQFTQTKTQKTQQALMLLIDYAAMINDAALLNQLQNDFQFTYDEMTLNRAVLCGSYDVISAILKTVDQINLTTAIFALFNVFNKKLLIDIFSKIKFEKKEIERTAHFCSQTSELLKEMFGGHFKQMHHEFALAYFRQEYSDFITKHCRPVSLLREIKNTPKSETSVINCDKILQRITELLKHLITKPPSTNSSHFFANEIDLLCKKFGYVRFESFSPEIKALFLEHAVIANKTSGFRYLTETLNIMPTSNTLNRAILCGAPNGMLNRILAWGVLPDENTLNCVLMSELSIGMVEKLLEKGMELSGLTPELMIYSRQTKEVNELLITLFPFLRTSLTARTNQEVLSYYQKHHPELVALFTVPFVLSEDHIEEDHHELKNKAFINF